MKGLVEKCERCGSGDIDGISRIVGYYSVINDWNKSKKGELLARERGNYNITSGIADNAAQQIDLTPKYSRSTNTEMAAVARAAEASCANGTCTL
jgi:hypothetical protein